MSQAEEKTVPERIKRVIERDTPALDYDIIESNLKHLQGQVLTVIEATVPQIDQCEATKMLIKGFFNDKLTHLFDMYGFESGKETPDYSDLDSSK